MDIVRYSFKKLLAKPGATLVAILLFAIGIGIISLVVTIERVGKQAFTRNLASIDLVVGAKGSPLQLILSTVFHLDTPVGNIPLSEANRIASDPMVRLTIPLAMGDNYKGCRIVGTTTEYARLYNAQLTSGNWFEQAFEVVIGAKAAKTTGLSIGDTFTGIHGFTAHGHHHDEHFYSVTGILKPTGTVIDQLVLTTLDSYWVIHGAHSHEPAMEDDIEETSDEGKISQEHGACCESHSHDEHCSHLHCQNDSVLPGSDEEAEWQLLIKKMEEHDELTHEEMVLFRKRSGQVVEIVSEPGSQITALLVFYQGPAAAIRLPRLINENTAMQAASPAFETHRLFSLIGTAVENLRLLAWLIIVISGINVYLHLMSTLAQGVHEIALMRVLGAGKAKVMGLLVLQGMWFAIGGWIIGITMSKTVMLWLSFHTEALPFQLTFYATDWWLLLYSLLAGCLAALPAAIKAYRFDVHFILTRE